MGKKNTLKGKHTITVVLAVAMLLAPLAVLDFSPMMTDAQEEDDGVIVTSGADHGPGTLRDVLASANDGQTIIIDPSVTVITLLSTITFNQADIVIIGAGTATITKDPSGNFRLLNSTAAHGTLTLKFITIQNGNSDGNGGGVFAASDVKLINCSFINNKSSLHGGGIYAQNISLTNCVFAGNTAGMNGGGVFAAVSAQAVNSTFISNTADNGGGVSSSTSEIKDCLFTGNTAISKGAAAFTLSVITMTDSGFEKNTSVNGTVFSQTGMIIAKNTSFFANSVSGEDAGIIWISVGSVLFHCTFTNNAKLSGNDAYNVFVYGGPGGITIENCLMTKDGLTANIGGLGNFNSGNHLGTDGTSDYISWFGTNTVTFNYIMPLPGVVPNASFDPSVAKDAAGNTRTASSCLYGAVNWTAVSWIVKNNNDSGTDSLRWAVGQADAYNASPLPDKRVVCFDEGVFIIKLTTTQIAFGINIMVVGRLGTSGQPEITIDGNSAHRIFESTDPNNNSLSYYYGLKIINGKMHNETGGGIKHGKSGIYALHCVFINNTTTHTSTNPGAGGAVYTDRGGSFLNCTFINNQSSVSGGGVFSQNATMHLDGCVFIGNASDTNAGGAGTNTNPITVENCAFIGNTASRVSSATSIGGGGISSANNAVVNDSIFINNHAQDGGGVRTSYTATIENCIFIGNTATNGGGVRVGTAGNITHCTFIGNTATNGGGVYGGGSTTTSYISLGECIFIGNVAAVGSGVAVSSSPLFMANCTLDNNTSTGDAGTVSSGTYSHLMHITITKNKGGGVFADTGKKAFLYNCIITGNVDNGGDPLQINGDIDRTYISNLIEGFDGVTHLRVFGKNSFDYRSNTNKVLSNGIAAGMTVVFPVTAINMTGISANAQQKAAAIAAHGRLNADQTGVLRGLGSVTYGAVETPKNSLQSISIDTNPSKMTYAVGEDIDLSGTKLSLSFTNGSSIIPYSETGVANTSAGVEKDTVGIKPVDFTFLGVTTTQDTCLYVTYSDSTTITITSDGGPTFYGEEAVFYAQVEPIHPGGTPTGTVTFYIGSIVIGTADLESGVATLRINDLSVGSHTITAAYEGGDGYEGSTTETGVQHQVNGLEFSIAITEISPDNPIFGQSVSITSQLFLNTEGSSFPLDGIVIVFRQNGIEFGTAITDTFGVAYIITSALPTGQLIITAEYEGDDNIDGCISEGINLDVVENKTTIQLGSSLNPSMFGLTIVFTVTVGAPQGTPTGTVELRIGELIIGTADLASGKASISVSTLPVGTHIVTAYYNGDEEHDGIGSEPLTQIVNELPVKNYYITAIADHGAKISPAGIVVIEKGDRAKFVFYALDGYSVEAVLIDGMPLSKTEIELGYFLFTGVSANHTIEVLSTVHHSLVIDIVNGKGRAEFSVNGSPFMEYTTAIHLKDSSSLTVRAIAEDGHTFKEWRIGTSQSFDEEFVIGIISSNIQLDLHFEEGISEAQLPWLAVCLALIVAVILIIAVWMLRRNE